MEFFDSILFRDVEEFILLRGAGNWLRVLCSGIAYLGGYAAT